MSDNSTIADLREMLKNAKRLLPNFIGRADHIRWIKSKIAALVAEQRAATITERVCNKTLIAFHEAGHAVTALALGFTNVSATIEEVPELNLPENPPFRGRCKYTPTQSRTDNRIVSVAGEVAEYMRQGGESWDWFTVDCFNLTDKRDLTPANLPLAIRRAVEILTARWQFVCDVASLLETEGQLVPHQTAGLWQIEVARETLTGANQ